MSSGIPLSAKFYADDKVKYSEWLQCTVLGVNDAEQTVKVRVDTIKANGGYQGKTMDLPGKAMRVLPPHEVATE